ncbi:hypothetical protein [Curtobacterium sp. L1-20]|uniref:hypothetical protein n=1 Tax=Curtobacterium sp. L1-20 TaxID=3138181 RepID=UPI003B5212B6
MANERDMQSARKAGEVAGFQEAVRQLRAFTGVTYDNGRENVTPDLELAEHLAYPRYRKDLAMVERELDAESDRMRAVVEQGWEQAEAAREALERAITDRRAARSERPAIARAAGWIGDQMLPLKADVKKHEELATRRHDRQWVVADDHRRVRTELARVDQWLEATAEQVAAAEAARLQDIEDAKAAAAAARRDSSPRWCTVFTREDFIAGDQRRWAHAWTGREATAGTSFGDHWRRDQDDYNGYGTWSLNWIEENHETFLEADDEVGTIWLLGTGLRSFSDAQALFRPLELRQNERNSIALVLDTYGNRFGPDDW